MLLSGSRSSAGEALDAVEVVADLRTKANFPMNTGVAASAGERAVNPGLILAA